MSTFVDIWNTGTDPGGAPSKMPASTVAAASFNNRAGSLEPSKAGCRGKEKNGQNQRREIQKRYRERTKKKQTQAALAVQETARQLAIAAAENRNLKFIQATLGMLTEQTSELLDIIFAAAGRRALHDNSHVVGYDATFAIQSMMDRIWSGELAPESWFPSYFRMPIPVLVQNEAIFITRLEKTMALWKVNLTERKKLETQMFAAMDARRRVTILLGRNAPDIHEVLLERVQPGTGMAGNISAGMTLAYLAHDINVSPHQLERLRAVWDNYLANVSRIVEEINVGKQNLEEFKRQVPSEIVATYVMHRSSQDLLATMYSAAVLAQMRRRMMAAYAELAAAVLTVLDVVQSAKLLLGCQPFLPDHAQLCKLLLDSSFE